MKYALVPSCIVMGLLCHLIVVMANLVSILFSCFFMYGLLSGRGDNLFHMEENLMKFSRVRWKHILVFSGSSIRADYEYELAMATSLI